MIGLCNVRPLSAYTILKRVGLNKELYPVPVKTSSIGVKLGESVSLTCFQTCIVFILTTPGLFSADCSSLGSPGIPQALLTPFLPGLQSPIFPLSDP